MYSDPSSYPSQGGWDDQLSHHAGLPPNNRAPSQPWAYAAYQQQPQQPYNGYSQNYGGQNQGFQTHVPPYTNGPFNQQGPVANYSQPSNVDPSLGHDPNAHRQHQQSQYSVPFRTPTPHTHSGTVTPQALQQHPNVQNARPAASPFQVSSHWSIESETLVDIHQQLPRSTSEMFAQRPMSTANVKPVPVPSLEIPKGKKSGGLYVLDQAALAKATKSSALNKLVTLGSEPFHLPTNRSKPLCPIFTFRNAHTDALPAPLPLYTPRQSVRELKKVGADNKKLLAKLSSSKPSIAKTLKTRTYAASPSELKREMSETDSETGSSDEDSEYTDDEDEEISPLPSSRPEEPHQAVRYDIIKATWCPQNPPPNAERIKAGMRDIWEVLSTIHKRWRTDTKAVTDAEAQKKMGELPVLKSRVASQRDLLQSALQAAIDHGHPDILFQMGQIKPFVYSCYQFLANRYHSKDFDGPLSAVIFEVLAKVGTLTSELLEETKLMKALVSMKKQTNDKHKSLIQRIVDSAAANTKKAKISPPPTTESKGVKRPALEPASRTPNEESLAKKSKPNESVTNATKKTLVASTTPKAILSTSTAMTQKKPMATAVPVKARVNQVTNKPSGIFASLNAASKKPTPGPAAPAASKAVTQSKATTGAAKDKKSAAASAKPAFSFAQTMASLLKPKEQETAPVKTEKQLPPETPEEKVKRLRKEERRHLRVTFKPDAALVQIKYFSHDPDEELGHDENFTRHAGDIEGEGRMFKQHKELEEDEDEDDGEREGELKPWKGEPSQVDFSFVPLAQRELNYTRYGGGLKAPSSPEKEAGVRRDNATLMVFYADSEDVPPSPREPLEQTQDAAPAASFKEFGTPPDRLRGLGFQTPAPSSVAVSDFRGLENIFQQFSNNNAAAPTQTAAHVPPVTQTPYMSASVPASSTDLAGLLSALQQSNALPPAPATAVFPPQLPTQQLPPMPNGPVPPNLDLQSIMQGFGLGHFPPAPPGFPPYPFLPPAQQQNTTGSQAQQQPQYNGQSNGGVKRQREETNNNDWGQSKKHKHRGERPHKVLPCKFFQKGTCNKGDNCTYVHDMNM